MTGFRYIETDGLPEGFDVADLIESGIAGDDLLAWCRDRVRPGPPPKPTKPRAAPEPPEGEKAGRGREPSPAAKPTAASNVVAMRKPEPAPEPGLPPEYSEDAIAERFTEQFAEGLTYVARWSTWMLWEGERWVRDDTQRAQDLSRSVCRALADEAMKRPELKSKARSIAGSIASARTVGNVLRLASTDRRHAATVEQWDRDEFALNTPAGVVDLRTGLVRPARKQDFVTKITRAAPGGACPRWKEFLKVATDGDNELIEFMRRVAGYCLTGSTDEQAFFFVYGSGGNGKGTFINTLAWMLNDYAQAASPELFTENRFTGGSDEAALARMAGARLVTAQEVEEGKRWNETRVKQVTGGDTITARFLYSNQFEYRPQFKLLFSGNHKPTLRNVDEAIRRRTHMIPFTVEVPAAKRDPLLAMKLREEAGGILEWAISGCLDWQRNTLAPPHAVLLTTKEYFESQDVIGQFWEQRVAPGGKVKTMELYREYAKFAESVGEFVLPQKRFLDAAAYRGVKPHKSNGVSTVEGIHVLYGDEQEPRASKQPRREHPQDEVF